MGHTLCLMRRMPSFFMSSLVARSLRRMNTHEVRFIPTAAQKNASSGFTLLVSAGTRPGRHFVCWVCPCARSHLVTMGPQAEEIQMGLLRKLLGLQPAKPVSSGTHSQLTSATSQQSKSAAAFDLPDE